MSPNTPRDGKPGTTDQSPRWEGPEETRPAGYLPALDNPEVDGDAAGENLNDPDRSTLGDAFVTGGEGPDQPGSLPEFTDPAHSSKSAGSPVSPTAPQYPKPPKDTQYQGHPEFSQDAAGNNPPDGIGNSEPVEDVDEKTRHSDGENVASQAAHPDKRTKDT